MHRYIHMYGYVNIELMTICVEGEGEGVQWKLVPVPPPMYDLSLCKVRRSW